MALTSDIFTITPTYSATLFLAAAPIAGAGAITLITSQPLDNGAGYQPIFTCAGDATAATFTIVGFVVGDLTGNTTTETVAGLNADIATSVNYYSQITSISSDAAVATNVSIGTRLAEGVALPRARLRGFYYIATAVAGSITLRANGGTAADRILLSIATPAIVAAQQMSLPGDGILMGGSGATSAFAVLINTGDVTSLTAFVG